MPDLRAALAEDRSLRAQLLELYPELAADHAALADNLEGLSSLDEQIAATIRVALEREAMADALGAMVKQITERKARLETGARKLRSLCLSVMTDAGRKRIGGTPAIPDMTVTLSPGRAKVMITDIDKLPPRFVVIEKKPLSADIGKALAAGEEVSGATLGNPQAYITVHRS